MKTVFYVSLVFLLFSPLVFADAYGNGSFGNGTYVGYTSPPNTLLTVNPATIPTVASSQITCTFSYQPSAHNDITKNYSISCRAENSGGLTTNKTGSLYALKDDGGGSSGGGGGGGTGATPSETFIFSQILPDAPVTKKLSNQNIAVKEIYIDVSSQSDNVKITVAKFFSTPAQTPQGNVFQYLEVNATISALKSAKFRFNVTKAWTLKEGSDVSMQRLSGTWQKLPTRLISESSSETQYESDVPGFSLFAITAEKPQPPPPQQQANQSPQIPEQAANNFPNLTKNIEDIKTVAAETFGNLQVLLGTALDTVHMYIEGAAGFIYSALPVTWREHSVYLFAIFVIIQLAIYLALRRLLREKKEKPSNPVNVRHNEKLHKALIWAMVIIILAIAIFIMRI